ncbi:hypothetical protein T10_13137 [Trichinella papuae]|uniref:Uncharacterized protein n=1 Tax=Trichinella papuae TaxID=268474 RepID=A0A0V1M9Q9_9BILA|nr:hypothetical protein T10_13137 [Trichinella papuae]
MMEIMLNVMASEEIKSADVVMLIVLKQNARITNDKHRMGSLHSPFQALDIWPRLYNILDSFTFSSIASPKNFPQMQPPFGQRGHFCLNLYGKFSDVDHYM